MENGFAVQEYIQDSVRQLWNSILRNMNAFESTDAFVCYGMLLMLPLLIVSSRLLQ